MLSRSVPNSTVARQTQRDSVSINRFQRPSSLGRKKAVDRFPTALPVVVVVELDRRVRLQLRVEMMQRSHRRVVPVGIDVQTCHSLHWQRRKSLFEQSNNRCDVHAEVCGKSSQMIG